MRFASEMSSAFVTSQIKCIGIYSKFCKERCSYNVGCRSNKIS